MNLIERVPQRIKAWLHQRGISDNIIEEYKIGWDGNRIVIPVFDQDHSILFNKYRRDPESEEGSKYSYDKGGKVSLFGIESLKDARNVVICEGEFDCLLLLSHGFNAVSSTGGCGSFNEEWSNLFINKNVYIVLDNDVPGIKGAFNIQSKIPEANIAWLPKEVGVGGDITDFFNLHDADSFNHLLMTAKQYRIPKPVHQDPATKKEMKEIIQENSQYASKLLDQKHELVAENLPTEHISILLDKVTDVIQADKRRLKYMGVKVKDNSAMSEKIRIAKQIPVDKYIDFNAAGQAKCIWHNDSHPSMYYYKNQNRVKCFSCGQMGDTIDVIMQLYDTDIKGALKIILNEY